VPLRRFFWPVFVAALALSSARPNAFDYSSQIGIVEFHPHDAACLTIQNASLKVGEAVRIIVMDEPQALETALVEKKLDKSCSRNPQVSPVSIAVVRFPGELHLKDGFAQADLTANGSAHSFRSCTSTEGLHLTVWDSAPSRKWHRYYYLGYDVEPNCTEKEYSDKR
jgi:hypothetical protein